MRNSRTVTAMPLLLGLALVASVSASSYLSLGVKKGDWIQYSFEEALAPGERWQKLEFLDVSGTTATVRITTQASGEVGLDQTDTIDISSSDDFPMVIFSARVYIIPSNLTTDDSVYLGQFGNRTITGETTRTSAGENRKVIYANFTRQSQYTFYWDKQTGILTEGTMVSGSAYKSIWVTETNMWTAESNWWFWAVIIISVASGLIVSRKSITRNSRRKK